MAKCFEIKGNRLIFLNNGESYIDDSDKKHISGNFTVIEFPPCFDQLYNDDFKYCKSQLAKVTKLDFTKATKIESISDDTFTGARSLKVVVLPKKVTAINEFKDCPNLVEIHIYKLEDLYAITRDKDKRLVVYASHVSSDVDSFDEGFLSDVGVLYVPANTVKRLEKARDDYDDELDIRPLPDGYSFPTEALSEPWKFIGGDYAPQNGIGTFENGLLSIREGITIIPSKSISGYDDLRKIIFPSTLTKIEESAIYNQEDLEELDFSKVTKLKEIPTYMLDCSGGSFKQVVIPSGVEKVGEAFLCSAEVEEIYIPESVKNFEFPIDSGEELETSYYVYSHNVNFSFVTIVDLNIYFRPEDYSKYKKKLENQSWWQDYKDDISLHKMPTEKLNFYNNTSKSTNNIEENESSSKSNYGIDQELSPFNQGDLKFKYIVEVSDAGNNKIAVAKAITKICSCNLKKAQEFVDGLDDLLSDDEVCSVDTLDKAQEIIVELKRAGADVYIRECNEYTISLDNVGKAKLQVVHAIKEILNCSLKQAKDFVDEAEDDLLGNNVKTVNTLKEALSIKEKLVNAGADVSISTSSSRIDANDEEEEDDNSSTFDLEQVYGGPQYHCVLAGQSFGPVTVRQFANMARFGIVNSNTLVWKNGMANWALASTVADLQTLV